MNEATKKCPFCFEEIKAEARKCKWCKSNLTQTLKTVTWFRDMPEKRWLGVSAMLANNTNIPALAWRIAFAVTTLYHGIGLVIYFAAWLLTPYRKGGKAPLERLVKAFQIAYETIRNDNGNEVLKG